MASPDGTVQEHYEPLQCDDCGAVFGYGEGDLNCCRFRCPACLLRLPSEPLPLGMSREAMLANDIHEGDIVTLGNPGAPARDERTGIPVPPEQRFRIVGICESN